MLCEPGWWQLKYVFFSSLFGEDSHFDEHIFQRGWFNHQLGTVLTLVKTLAKLGRPILTLQQP